MHKLLKAGLVLSIVAAGLLGFGAADVSAKGGLDWESVEPTLAKDDNHPRSMYSTDDNIKIEGDIDGTLYCVGNNVLVTGQVVGDVVCAARNITIDGSVGGSLRLAGQNINIKGSTMGDVTVAAQNVTLEEGSDVFGDLNGVGQNITTEGTILGENHTIKTVGPVEIDDSVWLKVLVAAMVVLDIMIFGVIASLVAPRFIDRSRKVTKKNPVRVAIAGFIAVVAPPLAVAIWVIMGGFFASAVILSAAVLAIYVGILITSVVFTSYLVGSFILKKVKNVVYRMAVGSAVVGLLMLIPIANIVVAVVSAIIGSGVFVATLTEGYRRPSYKIK